MHDVVGIVHFVLISKIKEDKHKRNNFCTEPQMISPDWVVSQVDLINEHLGIGFTFVTDKKSKQEGCKLYLSYCSVKNFLD